MLTHLHRTFKLKFRHPEHLFSIALFELKICGWLQQYSLVHLKRMYSDISHRSSVIVHPSIHLTRDRDVFMPTSVCFTHIILFEITIKIEPQNYRCKWHSYDERSQWSHAYCWCVLPSKCRRVQKLQYCNLVHRFLGILCLSVLYYVCLFLFLVFQREPNLWEQPLQQLSKRYCTFTCHRSSLLGRCHFWESNEPGIPVLFSCSC